MHFLKGQTVSSFFNKQGTANLAGTVDKCRYIKFMWMESHVCVIAIIYLCSYELKSKKLKQSLQSSNLFLHFSSLMLDSGYHLVSIHSMNSYEIKHSHDHLDQNHILVNLNERYVIHISMRTKTAHIISEVGKEGRQTPQNVCNNNLFFEEQEKKTLAKTMPKLFSHYLK